MKNLFILTLFLFCFCASANETRKLRVECKSPWMLVGIIEELRSLDYPIPPRLQEIEDEVCHKLNFERFFKSGAYAERLEEALGIIRGFDWRPCSPPGYKTPSKYPIELRSRAPALPVWETRQFLHDKVLSVGLKSYPLLADFNGDGLADLLVGDHDGFIYVYANSGSATRPAYGAGMRIKSASTGLDLAVAFNPKLNLADMNGDGKADLVLGSYDGKPYMIPNEARTPGEYRFDDHKFVYFKTDDGVLDVGNYAYPLVVDWNLDGLPDLLVGEIGGSVLLFRNHGTPKRPLFREPERIVSITPDMYPDPALCDIDGDGKRDLILGGREGKVYFFRNAGENRFPRFRAFTYVTCGHEPIDVGRLSHVHVGDWNADGQTDLLVGNDDGEVRVFTGRSVREGKLAFVKRLLLRTDEETELIAKTHPVVCFADWNDDGKLDVLAGGEGDEVRFYRNVGSTRAPRFEAYRLVAGVRMQEGTLPYVRPGEKRFWELAGLEFISEYLGNVSPEAADWDGDGRLDLLVGNYAGLVYFYRNTGTSRAPSLGSPQPLRSGERLLRVAGYSTPRAVDWNGDGLPDLITGDLLGRIHVYLNVGTKTQPRLDGGRRVRVAGKEFALGPRSIVEFADLNGDGLRDLVVGNRFGRVYALLNRGSTQRPQFDRYEPLRETGTMWRKLYGGGWAGPAGHFPLKWKMGKRVTELCVEATSCPRYVDFDSDGAKELMISHRFGRVFVYRPTRSLTHRE